MDSHKYVFADLVENLADRCYGHMTILVLQVVGVLCQFCAFPIDISSRVVVVADTSMPS